jgi:tubulin epsilon
MEQGPVFESLKGPFGELFEMKQTITDVSGAGNNFAHGYYAYGDQYAQPILV